MIRTLTRGALHALAFLLAVPLLLAGVLAATVIAVVKP